MAMFVCLFLHMGLSYAILRLPLLMDNERDLRKTPMAMFVGLFIAYEFAGEA